MSSEIITVKLVTTKEEMDAALAIRQRVFVEEQGVPPQEEIEEADATAIHVLTLIYEHPIGTGRLVTLPFSEVKIGRMAVEQGWRRRGVGSHLLSFLEEQARLQGMIRAVLNSQTYVTAFYSHHGYSVEGEMFMEAGIEHIRMTKPL